MSAEDWLSAGEVASVTAYVDVHAPPPAVPTAVLVFGTNQSAPVAIAARRFHEGLAPPIIATGGINRHNGIVEGREFHRQLRERGVPEEAIRYEERSANTLQNVEYSLAYLREAMSRALPITVVCKWYHRRAIHVLHTLLPDLDGCHALTWEPLYAGTPVTRTNWPAHPEGVVESSASGRRYLAESRTASTRTRSWWVACGGPTSVQAEGGCFRALHCSRSSGCPC
jgi:hypothetical protein